MVAAKSTRIITNEQPMGETTMTTTTVLLHSERRHPAIAIAPDVQWRWAGTAAVACPSGTGEASRPLPSCFLCDNKNNSSQKYKKWKNLKKIVDVRRTLNAVHPQKSARSLSPPPPPPSIAVYIHRQSLVRLQYTEPRDYFPDPLALRARGACVSCLCKGLSHLQSLLAAIEFLYKYCAEKRWGKMTS